MNAAQILEHIGRGIPAVAHGAMIVDVCAYMRSSQTPVVVALSDRGEVRGVICQTDIVRGIGRLGSSVMQMMASDLAHENAVVCQTDTQISEILGLLSSAVADFAVVCEGQKIVGVITLCDVVSLLSAVLGGDDQPAASAEVQEVEAEAVQPEAVQPEAAQPEAAQLEAVQPEAVPGVATEVPPAVEPAVAAAPAQTQQNPAVGYASALAQQLIPEIAPEPAAQPVQAQPVQQQVPPHQPVVPDVPPASAYQSAQGQVPLAATVSFEAGQPATTAPEPVAPAGIPVPGAD